MELDLEPVVNLLPTRRSDTQGMWTAGDSLGYIMGVTHRLARVFLNLSSSESLLDDGATLREEDMSWAHTSSRHEVRESASGRWLHGSLLILLLLNDV